jgi:DNA-binding response OmpR family regulator
MAVHILVVEDDATIAGAVADRLRSEGFDVTIVTDGLVALDLVDQLKPGLVVLDVMLPGLDGVEVCRRIHTKVPVVMLTARDDETDMLVGLAVGADDYITKPFSMRELVARIRVVLRRVERSTTPTVRTLGALRIDEAQRRVFRDIDEVMLTPTEFDILLCLFDVDPVSWTPHYAGNRVGRRAVWPVQQSIRSSSVVTRWNWSSPLADRSLRSPDRCRLTRARCGTGCVTPETRRSAMSILVV